MTTEKKGIFRRIGGWIGNITKTVRFLINIVFLVFIGLFIYSLVGNEVKPLPEKAALLLQPTGMLVEERSYADPLSQIMAQNKPKKGETLVKDLTDALQHGATDPAITGVILDLNYLAGGGISKMSTVAAAITRFKDSGKPVIAIADNYSQQQYYLASFADTIMVNPMGGVMITGFGYFTSFFKEAADKLKLNFHVFRAGEFKSAVEPFTRTSMSDEAKQNTLSWINELWQHYTHTIEGQRQLATGSVEQLVNNADSLLAKHQGDAAQFALSTGLVDEVASRPAMKNLLIKTFGEDSDGLLHVDYGTYLSHKRLAQLNKFAGGNGRVGVIIASGTILDGEQMEGTIGGDSLSALIRQARDDASIKALVLRIDSPGGSAFASDIIRQELLSLQKSMPVIVSMGAMAASGGYWIAAEADEIWAQPTTITGSIGVFGIIPTFENSLASLGIYSDGVGTTTLSDFNHLDRPLSPQAKQIIQLSIKNTYQKFISLVAKGRDSNPQQIDNIARGQVWTGQQAKALGLVDELGDLNDALQAAAKRAGLATANEKYITRSLSFQEQLLQQIAENSAASIAPIIKANLPTALINSLVTLKEPLDFLSLNDPKNQYLHCFGCVSH